MTITPFVYHDYTQKNEEINHLQFRLSLPNRIQREDTKTQRHKDKEEYVVPLLVFFVSLRLRVGFGFTTQNPASAGR